MYIYNLIMRYFPPHPLALILKDWFNNHMIPYNASYLELIGHDYWLLPSPYMRFYRGKHVHLYIKLCIKVKKMTREYIMEVGSNWTMPTVSHDRTKYLDFQFRI